MRRHSAASSETGSTSSGCPGCDHVDPELGGHVHAVLALDEGVLLGRRRGVEPLARGGRADQGQQRARLGHVLELHVAAERIGPEHVLEHGVADRLGVEPEPVVAAQDAQVGAELALVVQDGGVAPAPRLERLDVVRHLPLEEVGRLKPRTRNFARSERSTSPPIRSLSSYSLVAITPP